MSQGITRGTAYVPNRLANGADKCVGELRRAGCERRWVGARSGMKLGSMGAGMGDGIEARGHSIRLRQQDWYRALLVLVVVIICLVMGMMALTDDSLASGSSPPWGAISDENNRVWFEGQPAPTVRNGGRSDFTQDEVRHCFDTYASACDSSHNEECDTALMPASGDWRCGQCEEGWTWDWVGMALELAAWAAGGALLAGVNRRQGAVGRRRASPMGGWQWGGTLLLGMVQVATAMEGSGGRGRGHYMAGMAKLAAMMAAAAARRGGGGGKEEAEIQTGVVNAEGELNPDLEGSEGSELEEGDEEWFQMERHDYDEEQRQRRVGGGVLPDADARVSMKGLLTSEGDWAGHSFLPGQRREGMVIFAGNVRRLGRDHTALWEQMKARAVDFCLLTDHGLEVNDRIKQGQYCPHHTSGQALKQAELWGRRGMKWHVSQGMRGARGSTAAGLPEGGALVAGTAQWRARLGQYLEDHRGWGRFAGTVIAGGRRWHRQLVLVAGLCPHPSSAAWKRQAAVMGTLRPTEVGIEKDPRAQFYRDLYMALQKFEASGRMETAYIIMGDFNEDYDTGKRQDSVLGGVVEFAQVMGLDNAMHTIHGGGQRCQRFWTRREGRAHSCLDHILVSNCILKAGMVKKAGVWQGSLALESDHRMLGIEVECSRWLGITASRLRLRRPVFKVREPTLYLNDKEKVKQFKALVLVEYEKRDIAGKMGLVRSMVAERQAKGVEYAVDEPELQRAMDDLEVSFIMMLVECKNWVAGHKVVEGTRHRRHPNKGPSSPAQKKAALEIRNLDRLLHLAEVNKGAACRKADWLIKRLGAKWMGRPNLTSWRMREWADFKMRVQHRLRELKKKCNAIWREERRHKIQESRKRVSRAHKERKTREIIRRLKGEGSQPLDRDCIQVQCGEEVRVVDEAEELGQHLRDFFAQWFREGEDTWYQHWENGRVVWTHMLFRNNLEGWENRKRLVEGLSVDDPTAEFQRWVHEEVFHGVPEDVRWVLALYGRKYSRVLGRRVQQSDYCDRGVMGKISEARHDRYWAKKSANKANDYYGANANLVKALAKVVTWEEGGELRSGVLTWHVYDAVRQILQVVVDTGMVYSSWAYNMLLTAPKVKGSALLADTRPLGVLMLLRNAFYGIQFGMVKDTWEDLELISRLAYGAQRGLGTCEFRLMEVHAYEQGYMFKKDLGAGNEDKRRGFDLPSMTVGYSMGLKRLAVPDKLLMVDLKVGQRMEIMVRFVHGFAPSFMPCGFGSCGFSCTQGSEEGPDKYTGFEDPLNTWWEQQDMGIWVMVSEWQRVQLKGGGYMDDKKPIGEPEHLKVWYTGSSQMCKFHGAKINVPKCDTHFKLYDEDERLRWARDIEPMVVSTPTGYEAVTMKEADCSIKTLGGHTNPALYWADQMQEIRKMCEQLELMYASPGDRASAILHWDLAFVRALVYKALVVETTEERLYEVTKPAWMAYKRRLGLARSTPNLAAYACGVGDIWSKVMVERMMSLLRSLTSPRLQVREVAEAMLFLEQKWEGSARPCLERGQCALRGRSGLWVGDLRGWMGSLGITIEGGKGLPMLRGGDFAVVDWVDEADKGVVAAGLYCTEVWRASEFYTGAGVLRMQWLNGSWEEQMAREIEGASQMEKKQRAAQCMRAVQGALLDFTQLGLQLGRWRREAIRIGRYAIRRSGEAWGLVWVQSMGGEMRWDDVVIVYPLRCAMMEEDIEGCMCGRWRDDPQGQVWMRLEAWGEKAEPERCAAGELMPVHTWSRVLREDTEDGGIAETFWVIIDEDEEAVKEGGCRAEEEGRWEVALCEEKEDDEWDFEGRDELMGYDDKEVAEGMFEEMLRGRTVGACVAAGKVLLLYSDGSHRAAGVASRATYGWQIWGFKDEGEVMGMVGGGLVHGDPVLLDSTRAEHHGALAVVMAAYELGWRGKVIITMDNSAVIDRMSRSSDEGSKWGEHEVREQPRQWLRLKDPDVYAEAEAWEGRFEEVEWRWHRGHPEERKAVWEYNQHDRANVLCDEVAEQQYAKWPAERLRRDWWRFPHKPRWRVFARGMELQGDIRGKVETVVQECRMAQYMATKAANREAREDDERHAMMGTTPEGTKAGRSRELRSIAYSDMLSEWLLPGLVGPAITKFQTKGDQIITIKLLTNMLATEMSAAHRGAGGEVWPCRLCGQDTGGGETNYHVLWQCTADPGMVQQRNRLAATVWKVLEKYKLPIEDQLVASAMVWLKEGGEVAWAEIADLQEMLAGTHARPAAIEAIRGAAMGQRGEALDWARKGSMGANWMEALKEMGVAEGVAYQTIQQLNLEVRKGAVKIWRAFTAKVHGAEEKVAQEEMEKAEELLQNIFEGEDRGELVAIGKMVKAWPFTKRKKWLQQYLHLEEKVGRDAAIERSRALAERPCTKDRITLRERWDAAMRHADRRDATRSRGQRGMPDIIGMMMDVEFRRDIDGREKRAAGKEVLSSDARAQAEFKKKFGPEFSRQLRVKSGDKKQDMAQKKKTTKRLGAKQEKCIGDEIKGESGKCLGAKKKKGIRAELKNKSENNLTSAAVLGPTGAVNLGKRKSTHANDERTRRHAADGAGRVDGTIDDCRAEGGGGADTGEEGGCAEAGRRGHAAEHRETGQASHATDSDEDMAAEIVGCGMGVGGCATGAGEADGAGATSTRTQWGEGGQLADAGDDEVRVDRKRKGRAAGEGSESDEGDGEGLQEPADYDYSERAIRVVRRGNRNRQRRRAATIGSDSEGDEEAVDVAEERLQGAGGEEGFLGDNRDHGSEGYDRGGCWEEPRGGGLAGAGCEADRAADEGCADAAEGGVNGRQGGAAPLCRPGGSDSELEEGSSRGGAALLGDRHEGVGVLCSREDLGAEHGAGLHSAHARGAVDGGRGTGEGKGRVAGSDGACSDLGLSSLPHIQHSGHDQHQEGVQLQESQERLETASGGEHQVQQGGQGVGHAGEAPAEGVCILLGRVEGGMVHGEPGGQSAAQTFCGAHEAAEQEAQGQLLRLQGVLQEADAPVEQHQVGTKRHHRDWDLLQQVREGQGGQQGEVGAQVCNSTEQQPGDGGTGEEGEEGGGATPAAPGTAAELPVQDIVGQPRQRQRRRRKRKRYCDEWELLSSNSSTEHSDVHDEGGLEGFRMDCKSSLRNG